MWNSNLSANSLVRDEMMQQQLHEPFLRKDINKDCESPTDDAPSYEGSMARVIVRTILSLLLVVQFNIGLRNDTDKNLHHYTVNWCIGLWIIASRLFRKTVQDADVKTIPEWGTGILLVMVAIDWLEGAFLVMVLSTTVVSLHFVVRSLFHLANLYSESIAESNE
jgi:hypothetical protein